MKQDDLFFLLKIRNKEYLFFSIFLENFSINFSKRNYFFIVNMVFFLLLIIIISIKEKNDLFPINLKLFKSNGMNDPNSMVMSQSTMITYDGSGAPKVVQSSLRKAGDVQETRRFL